MKKKIKEIKKPMVKKLAKIKSRTASRRRNFRTCFCLAFGEVVEEGRIELAQPPRRPLPPRVKEEKAILANNFHTPQDQRLELRLRFSFNSRGR